MERMKVNWLKMKIITKNMEKEKIQDILEKTKLQQERWVRYLGIYMTDKCSTLMEDNYMKLLQKIQSNLEKWDKLNLSLLERIVTKWMFFLIFFFQTIPILLKQTYF